MPTENHFRTPSAPELVLNLLKQNTPVCFNAGGPSMTPVIRDGDTVQVRPLKPGDLRCGAILLHLKNGRPVLHRLIRKETQTGHLFFTGDAALRGEDRMTEQDVAGIATRVLHAGRPTLLDTPVARLRGMLRYRLRPLRRLILENRRHQNESLS